MYVVLGANGFIGTYAVKNILSMTEETVLAVGRTIKPSDNPRIASMRCDLTNTEDVQRLIDRIKNIENTKIVYLVAYHHPDEVKSHPRIAWNINVTVLSYILNQLENIKCLFYISTEMVYGEGTSNYYFKENDMLKPVNLYGQQKVVAESIVNGYGYNVVRFPFVIGPSLLPNKKHFYDEIVDTLQKGKAIEMFQDSYKSALDFDTATRVLVCLMEKHNTNMPPILNISGDEKLSKYQIGQRIARKHHLPCELVKPILLNDDAKIFTEVRANCALLDNSLVKKILNLSEIKINL